MIIIKRGQGGPQELAYNPLTKKIQAYDTTGGNAGNECVNNTDLLTNINCPYIAMGG